MGGLPRARMTTAPDPGRPIVVALPKGRVLGQAIDLFRRAGYPLDAVEQETRRLVHECGPIRALVLRAGDVPTYVEYGAADIGVAGRDVLEEEERDLYEPLDLGIGACRMVLAEPIDRPVDLASHMHLRVATKYPTVTRRYLEERGVAAEIIKLSGSVELGPLTGLADRIVDLVETGETLRQNGLVEVETILQVTSRLVVNPASLKLRGALVAGLIDRLAAAARDRREL
ncbi:MAG TPA: ATP phosphoribosyltransferase [Kofleriaceae bacterium]|nr:ATP phosphoribosyltransferase [Kofleriaceae bacterium]